MDSYLTVVVSFLNMAAMGKVSGGVTIEYLYDLINHVTLRLYDVAQTMSKMTDRISDNCDNIKNISALIKKMSEQISVIIEKIGNIEARMSRAEIDIVAISKEQLAVRRFVSSNEEEKLKNFGEEEREKRVIILFDHPIAMLNRFRADGDTYDYRAFAVTLIRKILAKVPIRDEDLLYVKRLPDTGRSGSFRLLIELSSERLKNQVMMCAKSHNLNIRGGEPRALRILKRKQYHIADRRNSELPRDSNIKFIVKGAKLFKTTKASGEILEEVVAGGLESCVDENFMSSGASFSNDSNLNQKVVEHEGGVENKTHTDRELLVPKPPVTNKPARRKIFREKTRFQPSRSKSKLSVGLQRTIISGCKPTMNFSQLPGCLTRPHTGSLDSKGHTHRTWNPGG